MATSSKTCGVNSLLNILVWPQQSRRSFLSIQNQSTLDILVGVGAVPAVKNAHVIPPGEEWCPTNPPKGDIRVIGTALAGVFQTFYTIEETGP